MLVHRYQAQLNRFTTLSSPGSQDLPPGLPPYVNPHIEHSENMTQDIFYISAGQAGHLVLLIILAVVGQPGVGGVSSVGLRDTECKPSPIFMAPLKIICSCSTRVISLFLLVEGNTEDMKHFCGNQAQWHMHRLQSSPTGKSQGNPNAQVSSAASCFRNKRMKYLRGVSPIKIFWTIL